jgi:flagellar biosynthesis protein FlhA
VRILDNVELDANAYRINLSGHPVASGQVHPGRLMAMKPDGRPEGLKGIEAPDPSFGLPVVWVARADREKAEMAGCTLVDPESVFITHLSEVVRRHAHEILNRQDVRELLDSAREQSPAVVEDLVPDVLSVGTLQNVLENLLAEDIPVNDLARIIEKCGGYAGQVQDPDVLTELVRKSLSRAICARFSDENGEIHALSVDPALEERLREGLEEGEGEQAGLSLPPALLRQIMEAVREETAAAQGEVVILTDPRLRRSLRDIVRRASPEVPVIAYDEICDTASVQTIGMICVPSAPIGAGAQEQTSSTAAEVSERRHP